MNNPLSLHDVRLTEEAAAWCERIERDASPECQAELDRWLAQSPLNVREFLLAHAVWKEVANLDPARLGHLKRARSEESRYDRRRRSPFRGRLIAALAVAASVAAAVIFHFALGTVDYRTGIGGQQTIKLQDGSIVLLNTDSDIQVQFDGQRRHIRLLRGEALFTVSPDPARPFIVQTHNAEVRALGTVFNVRYTDALDTRVAVVEGTVQVSSHEGLTGQTLRLEAGDEGRIRRAAVSKASVANVKRAVAWRERRLVFPGNQVAEIAAELNRYNRLQIRIEGAEVRHRVVSGVFDVDNPIPLIQFMERFDDLEVVWTDDAVIIRAMK